MSGDDILKEFSDRLSTGLDTGKCKIDDIERMMGEAIERFKGTIETRAEEIIRDKPSQGTDECIICGRALKKTKQRDRG